MKFEDLRDKTRFYPIFKLEDVFKWFPKADRRTVIFQLSLWTRRGLLEHLKRGIYKIADYEIKDSFILANFLYSPSYISLETALNYYSIIPDVPFSVTSVSTKKTNTFRLKRYGQFNYVQIKPDLFFGFETIVPEKNYSYNIALPEKAVFDLLYFRSRDSFFMPEKFLAEARFTFEKDFHWEFLRKWEKIIPALRKKFHCALNLLFKKYD